MKKQHLTILLLLLFISRPFFSQDLPRIEADPFYTTLSSVEGQLNEEQLINAALFTSGSSDVDLYKTKLKGVMIEAGAAISPGGTDYEKGEAILKYLHDNLFTVYEEDQTEVDTLLRTGRFNCVSSAVIYLSAGRAAGLDLRGVRTADHAFVSLFIGDSRVDVETTNLWGFDPGQKKEFKDSFSGSTGYNYVPPGNYLLRQDITDRQMIGLILQNRIASLQRRNNHRDSVPLAIDRYALTESPDAQKDMYDTFSNYASRLNTSGQYEKGIEFLLSAMELWGSSEKPLAALEALVHNQLLSMVEKGQSDEALAYLTDFIGKDYLSDQSIRSNTAMIYDRKTVDLINSGQDFLDIRDFVNKVYEQGYLSDVKWIDYTVYNYIKEAERVAKSAGWLDAFLFVRDAPLEIQNNTKYLQLLNSCRSNYAVTVHNSFADYFNEGRFDEAEAVIRSGLAYIPENRTLNSDLQMILRKKTQ